MDIVKRLRSTIGLALRAAGAAAAGTAALLSGSTLVGRRLTERAQAGVGRAIQSLLRRLGREPLEPVPTTDEESEAEAEKIAHEHAREHGAEGRAWASAHARRPHAAEAVPSDGVRNVVLRRAQRHV